LETIEKSVAQPQQAQVVEPEGPTPEQIVGLLDQRIAETDRALSQAELEDPAQAPALRQQLRQLERYYNNYVNNLTVAQAKGPDPEAIVQKAVHETTVQGQFKAIKSNIVNEFPVLDANSEYFNESLRDQVHEIYNPMLAAGKDPVEALIQATMLVTKANGIQPMSELVRLHYEQEAAKKAEAELKKTEKQIKAVERKAEQVNKNVQAAQATPPNLANAGVSGESHGVLDKYDFSKMSLSEFNKIPEAELEMIESTLMLYNNG
jgi:flagellar biosynthesis chaperone FliJ